MHISCWDLETEIVGRGLTTFEDYEFYDADSGGNGDSDDDYDVDGGEVDGGEVDGGEEVVGGGEVVVDDGEGAVDGDVEGVGGVEEAADGVEVVVRDEEVVDDEVLENGGEDGIWVKTDDTGMLQNLLETASDLGPMSCKAVVG